MHIVHIATRILRAGSEENILLTSAGQINEGHKVTLVFGGNSRTDLIEKLSPEADMIEVSSLIRPLNPLKDIQALLSLRKVLLRLAPDVIHTHQSKAGIVGRFAAAAARVPCIVHGVHILPFIGVRKPAGAVYLLAERAAAKVTDGYIHVSQGMMDCCLENRVGFRSPHAIVYSGFDINRFRAALSPTDCAELIGSSESQEPPIVLTMLASLEPRKRHLELLRALSELLSNNRRIRLVFAGEGPIGRDIADLAETLGVREQVRLLGYRNDPERIIAMSDICLLASAQEGLPRSILQCIAGGKPVVMFDLPGISVVVENGRNALVVSPGDWTEYRSSVKKLIEDSELRRKMSRASADIDMSRWDWQSMGRQTNAFYESVMKEKNRPLV